MSKEITKANILQQIQDKFALREFEPEVFRFSEMVVPTYDIEPHLKTPYVKYNEISITGIGAFDLVAVPAHVQRWFSRYDVIFMGAGAYTVSGIFLRRKASGNVDSVYLDLTAGQSTSYHVGLPVPILLGPGDLIGVTIDGYTSTQDLRFYYDYEEEILR